MRYTFNINAMGIRNYETLIKTIAAIKPTTMFVLDGIDLAVTLKKYLAPNGIMIHRFYQKEEGGYWQHKTPEAAINDTIMLSGQHAYSVYHAFNNEPEHDPSNLPKLIQWMIDVMEVARKRNIRLAIGELAVAKTLHKQDIDNGLWDNFLRTLDKHKDFHILSVHEYTAITLPFTFHMDNNPRNWLTSSGVDVSKWNKEPLRLERKQNGELPDYWHLLRTGWLLIRAKELGLQFPKFVITEGLWDKMDDLNAPKKELGNKGLYDILKAQFNTDIRGIMSYVNIYPQLYFPNWAFDDAVIQQLSWADEIVYPKECIGIALFAWNRNWEIALHDYSHNSINGVIERLKEYAVGKTTIKWRNNVSNTKNLRIWSNHSGHTLIRAEPNANSNRLGVIPQDGITAEVTLKPIQNGIHYWYNVKINNTSGYVRSDVVHIEEIKPADEAWMKSVYEDYIKRSGITIKRLYKKNKDEIEVFHGANDSFNYAKLEYGNYDIIFIGNPILSGGNEWQFISALHNGRYYAGWVKTRDYSTIQTDLPQKEKIVFEYDKNNNRDSLFAEIIRQIIKVYNDFR